MPTSIVEVRQEFETLGESVKVFRPFKLLSRLAVVSVKIFEVGCMQAKLSNCLFYKLQFFGLKLIYMTACRPKLALPSVKLAKLFSDWDQVGKNPLVDILGHLVLYTLSDCI